MDFFSLPKQEQLDVLGSMYELMRGLPPARVNLDLIMFGQGKAKDCGSVGCLAGWCAVTPDIAARLDIAWNPAMGYLTQHDNPVQVINPEDIFGNKILGNFLFSAASHMEERSLGLYEALGRNIIKTRAAWRAVFHQRLALLRLIYVGEYVRNGFPIWWLGNSWDTPTKARIDMLSKTHLLRHVGLEYTIPEVSDEL